MASLAKGDGLQNATGEPTPAPPPLTLRHAPEVVQELVDAHLRQVLQLWVPPHLPRANTQGAACNGPERGYSGIYRRPCTLSSDRVCDAPACYRVSNEGEKFRVCDERRPRSPPKRSGNPPSPAQHSVAKCRTRGAPGGEPGVVWSRAARKKCTVRHNDPRYFLNVPNRNKYKSKLRSQKSRQERTNGPPSS